ncbi:MAG: nuclear transport factor 2 family protein [Deltaproteobacteria bacterium]|nr:nuclear transport factor 2 family protein [Deltaproteobacteria bacterium]
MRNLSLPVLSALSLMAAPLAACGKKADHPGPTDATPTETAKADAGAKVEADAAKAEPDAGAKVEADAAKAEPDAGAKVEADAAKAEADVAKVEDVARPLPANVEEAAITNTLKVWLAAQNAGDFASYSALYAPRFTGVKRAGDRTTRFDRARWLVDRQRMFGKAMKVEASQIEVEPSQVGAVVRFTQAWESGTYKDVGPKQIVFVKTADGLRIAKEEMLASQVEGATDQAAALTAGQFQPIVVSEGFIGVVSAPVADTATLPHKAPVSLQRGRAAYATLDGQPDDKPTFELFGENGKVCDAPARERGLFVDVIHHFGQIQTWNGENDEPRLDDAGVAAALLGGNHGGTYEVWKVDADACKGALWARMKGEGASPVLPSIDAAPLAERALKELRKLAAWKAIQKDFDSDETTSALKKPWDTHESTPLTHAWKAADGTTYVSFSVTAGAGCGSFGGSTWGLWRVTGETWTLLTDGTSPGDIQAPTAAADLDGDGRPEFTDGETLIQPVGATWRATISVAPPDYDCPC